MYLHLGNETTVLEKDIIGIFDIETCSVGNITREFLKNCEDNMLVTDVSNDLPKSFVLTQDKTTFRVYVSQIASKTIKGRQNYNYIDEIKNIK